MKRLLLLVFFVISAFANVGKVIAIKGDASANSANGVKRILQINSEIFENDIIITGKNAKLQIVFIDNTVTTIGKNTTLNVKEYYIDGKNSKVELEVNQGSFKVITGQISKLARENFKLRAKTATIGIRGTVFVGEVSDKLNKVACLKGAIDVKIGNVSNRIDAGKQISYTNKHISKIENVKLDEFSEFKSETQSKTEQVKAKENTKDKENDTKQNNENNDTVKENNIEAKESTNNQTTQEIMDNTNYKENNDTLQAKDGVININANQTNNNNINNIPNSDNKNTIKTDVLENKQSENIDNIHDKISNVAINDDSIKEDALTKPYIPSTPKPVVPKPQAPKEKLKDNNYYSNNLAVLNLNLEKNPVVSIFNNYKKLIIDFKNNTLTEEAIINENGKEKIASYKYAIGNFAFNETNKNYVIDASSLVDNSTHTNNANNKITISINADKNNFTLKADNLTLFTELNGKNIDFKSNSSSNFQKINDNYDKKTDKFNKGKFYYVNDESNATSGFNVNLEKDTFTYFNGNLILDYSNKGYLKKYLFQKNGYMKNPIAINEYMPVNITKSKDADGNNVFFLVEDYYLKDGINNNIIITFNENSANVQGNLQHALYYLNGRDILVDNKNGDKFTSLLQNYGYNAEKSFEKAKANLIDKINANSKLKASYYKSEHGVLKIDPSTYKFTYYTIDASKEYVVSYSYYTTLNAKDNYKDINIVIYNFGKITDNNQQNNEYVHNAIRADDSTALFNLENEKYKDNKLVISDEKEFNKIAESFERKHYEQLKNLIELSSNDGGYVKLEANKDAFYMKAPSKNDVNKNLELNIKRQNNTIYRNAKYDKLSIKDSINLDKQFKNNIDIADKKFEYKYKDKDISFEVENINKSFNNYNVDASVNFGNTKVENNDKNYQLYYKK